LPICTCSWRGRW